MASLGGLEALVGGLDANTKKSLVEVLRALVPNLRIGPLDTAKAENFLAYKVTSTTASSTGEFSVEHGMGRTPYLAIPVMDVGSSRTCFVPLEVTRPADARRIYVKTDAGFTDRVFALYLE